MGENAWPWYVSGPLIGLIVPALLIWGGKMFGISSSFRHLCAMIFPRTRIAFLRYDWRAQIWNLSFVLGIVLGGWISAHFLATEKIELLPAHYDSLCGSLKLLLGGFLVGFGARYAGGCTSGHAVMGISDLQPSSLVSAICFFVGGFLTLGIVHLFGWSL